MTRRRFFAPPSAFAPSLKTLTLAADEARHLRDVLRLNRGDEVFVFNGEGKEFRCAINSVARNSAELEVVEEVDPARFESPLRLTLAVALLKGEKFDLVVQKATELGVTRLLPVMTKLADLSLRDDLEAGKRVTRWQRIALEAAKQSGRAFVPTVAAPLPFAALLSTPKEGQSLMFSERGGRSLVETRKELPPGLSSITALVGSEGGWTDDEIVAAQGAGWKVVTLGGRTLRAETAAMVVAVLLQHLFGDLL